MVLKLILKIGYPPDVGRARKPGSAKRPHEVHGAMIVCLCRGVTERELIEASRNGAASIEEVARSCSGAGLDCGTCQPVIADIIASARTDTAA
jgi:bacterioferritin-associated ferredoxin